MLNRQRSFGFPPPAHAGDLHVSNQNSALTSLLHRTCSKGWARVGVVAQRQTSCLACEAPCFILNTPKKVVNQGVQPAVPAAQEEAEGVGTPKPRLQISVEATAARLPFNKYVGQAQWHTSVTPVILEAEKGGSQV